MTATTPPAPRASRIDARDRLFLLFAPALAIVSPVLAAASHLRISIESPAVLLIIGLIAATGLVLGAIAAAAHGRGAVWGDVFKSAALTIAVLITVDIAFRGHSLLNSISGDRLLRALLILIAALLVFAILWLVRAKIAPIFFAGAVAIFATTVATSTSWFVPEARAQGVVPQPVFHLILDEMIGPEGIPRSLPGGEDTYQLIRSVFSRHGFRIYGKAFSRHFMTAKSIPAILNFDDKENSDSSDYPYSKTAEELESIALFKKWHDHGYRINVYQSDHIDYCNTKIQVDCHTFPSFDPMQWVEGSDEINKSSLGLLATTRVLQGAFRGSYFFTHAGNLLAGMLGGSPVPTFFDGYGAVRWLQEIADAVLENPAGAATFAHVLTPHAPSVLDSTCQRVDRSYAPYYLVEGAGLEGESLETARQDYYRWYFDQVACTMAALDDILDKLLKDPRLANATIVIQGDHGSRISAGKMVENLSARDFVDNYSTLFAVRGPGIAPGYDLRMISVQRLVAEYLGGMTDIELGEPALDVVVSTKAGIDKVVPMVDFGGLPPEKWSSLK